MITLILYLDVALFLYFQTERYQTNASPSLSLSLISCAPSSSKHSSGRRPSHVDAGTHRPSITRTGGERRYLSSAPSQMSAPSAATPTAAAATPRLQQNEVYTPTLEKAARLPDVQEPSSPAASASPTAGEALRHSLAVGLSGGGATVFSVATLMWLHTIITFQQRHGTKFGDTCKVLLHLVPECMCVAATRMYCMYECTGCTRCFGHMTSDSNCSAKRMSADSDGGGLHTASSSRSNTCYFEVQVCSYWIAAVM